MNRETHQPFKASKPRSSDLRTVRRVEGGSDSPVYDWLAGVLCSFRCPAVGGHQIQIAAVSSKWAHRDQLTLQRGAAPCVTTFGSTSSQGGFSRAYGWVALPG